MTQPPSAPLSKTKYEYAYYFPEGPGYLYVGRLGAGQYGTVDLVWDCAEAARESWIEKQQAAVIARQQTDQHDSNDANDPADQNDGNDGQQQTDPHDGDEETNQTDQMDAGDTNTPAWYNDGSSTNSAVAYGARSKFLVRKKTRLLLPPEDNFIYEPYPMQNPEIANFRHHRRIPTLIDWEDYRPLPRDHVCHLHLLSTAMIFQFCNGGDLKSLIETFAHNALESALKGSGPVFIPESFIWKAFGQLLEVINWLHHLQRGIRHGDLHLGNVFVHYATLDQIVPDCFLGDFGLSQMIRHDAWYADTISGLPGPDVREYEDVLLIIKELMTLRKSTQLGSAQVEIEYRALEQDANYSRLLFAVIKRFENMLYDFQQNRRLADFADLARHMIAHGESIQGLLPLEEKMSVIDLPKGPLTFSSAMELLVQPEDELPPGPWKVAKIRSDTKAVVALSQEVYRTYQPLPPEVDQHWSIYTTAFRDGDEHSIPRSERDVPRREM